MGITCERGLIISGALPPNPLVPKASDESKLTLPNYSLSESVLISKLSSDDLYSCSGYVNFVNVEISLLSSPPLIESYPLALTL